MSQAAAPWSQLTWTALRVTLRAEEATTLMPHKGSLLRGALGHRLQETSCWEAKACDGVCQRPHACAYGAVWESSAGCRGDAPKPYVLAVDPSTEGRTEFQAGDVLRFTVRVLGEARPWGPWVRDALAGTWQLGHRRSPWRAESVVVGGETQPGAMESEVLADGGWPSSPSQTAWPIVRGADMVSRQPYAPVCRLRMRTPVDLRVEGRTQARPSGELIAVRALERVCDLIDAYAGGNEGPVPRDDLRQAARQVATVECQWRDATWERNSSVRGRHPLHGVLGEAVLRDIAPELWPFLVLAQYVHLGKGATFGQGMCEVEGVESPRLRERGESQVLRVGDAT